MRIRALLLGVALASMVAQAAHAETLDAIGPTYPIAEQSFLEVIMARLREKERTGELKKFEDLARARATRSVMSPTPVPDLRRVEVARTFYFDPTFALDRNIVDENGSLLFQAGTRKNPLDVVSLSKHLLFFDARDPRQVARAREVIELYQGKVKPILVGGSYIDLMKAWNKPVYYDQGGVLVRKLGITAVPAIVSQEGARLRIDEVVAK